MDETKTVKDLFDYLKAMLESGELTGDEDILLLQDQWSYCRGFEKDSDGLFLKMDK